MSLPIRLIVWSVAGIAASLASAVLARNLRASDISPKGKRMAILGARGVGKTNLSQFLGNGSLPEEHRQTVVAEKVPARNFSIEDLELMVSDTMDVAGGKDSYGEWKELLEDADIVLYLLRADKLIEKDEDTTSRVRSDLIQVSQWLDDRAVRPMFFIVGTHCDLDPAYNDLIDNSRGDYVDRFRELPIIADIIRRSGGTQRTKLVLGSAKTVASTESLVHAIFKQVP